MGVVDHRAARPGVADVAEVQHAPLAFPQGGRATGDLGQHVAELGALIGAGDAFGHRLQVFEPVLHLVEGTGQVEDHLAALASHHPAGGERAAVADRLHVVDDRQVDPSRQQEVGVQRVHHPGDRHRTRGGDQRLGQHLAAEDPLQQGVGLSRPEQVDLDLLEIEQIDQLIHRLRHGASLATDLRWARAQGPRAGFAAVGSPHSGGGRGHRRPGHGPIPTRPWIRPRRGRATAHLVPRGRRHLPPGQRGPSAAVAGSGGRGGRAGRADQPPALRRSSRPGAVRGRRGRDVARRRPLSGSAPGGSAYRAGQPRRSGRGVDGHGAARDPPAGRIRDCGVRRRIDRPSTT